MTGMSSPSAPTGSPVLDTSGETTVAPLSAKELLAQGHYHARAKRYSDAEASFLLAIQHDADLAAAYNNLGWVQNMMGDAQKAASNFEEAVRLDPLLKAARKNLLKQLVESGERRKSYELCYNELASGADQIDFLEHQFSEYLARNQIEIAGEYAALLAALKWGSKWYPIRGEISPTFLMEGKVYLTLPKLIHDWEQLTYLHDRKIIGDDIQPVISEYRSLIEHMKGDEVQTPTPLDEQMRSRIGHVYNRIVYSRPTPALPQALSDCWDRSDVQSNYLDGSSGFVVIDDFLTQDALENIRQFCLESTVWSGNRYNHGRLGAFFRDGFNCPLLLQIASELQENLPRVIGRRYPLQQLWGFKTGQTLPADSTTHADFAAVNVNFWITPDDANMDKNTGGLVIYDVQAPLDWDFNTYNGKLEVIGSFLHRKKASSVRIPYKQNRAIIFNSDLFHATEAVHFRPGYENHRVNVTMLYGYRHDDVHHLDKGIEQSHTYAGWRSAAFRR